MLAFLPPDPIKKAQTVYTDHGMAEICFAEMAFMNG